MAEIERFLGEISAKMDGLAEKQKEMNTDIKSLLNFQATTDERLKTGVNHFAQIEVDLESLDDRVCTLETEPEKISQMSTHLKTVDARVCTLEGEPVKKNIKRDEKIWILLSGVILVLITLACERWFGKLFP